MTITSMAKELGVSSMTIYRRMKRAGLDVADFRDPETGDLTSEGVAAIGNLFSTTGTTNTTTEGATPVQPAPQPIEMEAAVLRERVQGLTDRLAMAEAERDRLREQVDVLTEMLRTEQLQRQRLLTDGHQHQRRRGGLFGWMRRRDDGSGTD